MPVENAPEEVEETLDSVATEATTAPEEVATEVETPSDDGWQDFDFAAWDGENIEDVPEKLRGAATFFQGRLKTAREEQLAALEEEKGKSQYHKTMWENMLRDEDPERYAKYQQDIKDAKAEALREKEAREALAAEHAALREQHVQHTEMSNEKYLSWVEQKWSDDLVADREAGGDIIKSAEELVVELQVDPDDALRVGFKHGIEAMADLADFLGNNVPMDKALALVARLHPETAAAPEPEPVVEPEPAPEPEATHSPAADLAEPAEVPRAPQRSKRTGTDNLIFSADKLESTVFDVATSLFGNPDFRSR